MRINAIESREEDKFIECLKSDRVRQEIQLVANKLWDKTALKNYVNYGDLKTTLSRYAYYSADELDTKFTESYYSNFNEIVDLDKDLKSKINVICDDLIPLLNSDALEYVRYRIIEQELLNYSVIKNVDVTAIKTVMNLLSKTNINDYYPKFTEALNSKATLGKCFTEKYLDETVYASEGSNNFKYFIDKIFRLYNQFVDIDNKNAESKFIELLNATIKSGNCVLLIMSKEENAESSISINLESVVFAKNNYPKFYPIPQSLNIEIAKSKDRAILKTQNNNIVLSNNIKRLINEVYELNELGAYKKLSNSIIRILIKEKLLERRSEDDTLCKICNRRRATGFRNQKICKDCVVNINLIATETESQFDSIKKSLIGNKPRAIKRYKKLVNSYKIINWLEYLDEEV